MTRRLCDRGEQVRVLSRRLSSAFPVDARAETVRADVRDAISVQQAVRGADVVVSAVHGFAGPGGVSPESVDRDGNGFLIEAAERVDADVVLVSVAGASRDSPMELSRMKYAAEQRLRQSSIRWTIVRSEPFAETWVALLEQTAGRSHRPLIFGRGENPLSWVAVEDVAALVERAALDPALRGRTLEICGPEAVSVTRLAEMLMQRRGWEGYPRHVPPVVLRAVAGTLGRIRPDVGRMAAAAFAMDTLPAGSDAAIRREFTDLPCTPITRVVASG